MNSKEYRRCAGEYHMREFDCLTTCLLWQCNCDGAIPYDIFHRNGKEKKCKICGMEHDECSDVRIVDLIEALAMCNFDLTPKEWIHLGLEIALGVDVQRGDELEALEAVKAILTKEKK